MTKIDRQGIIDMANSAFQNLDKALDSQSTGDEKQVRYLSWKASSDVEYALFLFSIGLSDDDININWKLPSLKPSEIKSMIIKTQKMLNASIKDIHISNLKEAYQKMWLIKSQLLMIHDFFEKKRKKIKKS